MSTTSFIEQIDYPESDGKPMGETDLHRRWMIRIFNWLEYRYRDQRVYLGSDLLVYYEQGHPTRYIVPDVFVVFDCPLGDRRVFETWEENRVPDVVFEVTSRGTSSQDIVDKPKIYEQMGVSEYFLYDPNAKYLRPPLQGYRLINGILTEIPAVDGSLTSERLGVQLRLKGQDLEMTDTKSGKRLITEAEGEHLQAAAERTARLEVEVQLRELQEELKRLKDGKNR
jgi:Uma2 family endonuclease